MSRLIYADDLRQVLEVYSEKDSLGHTPVQLCDAMPTVDAVPVVHGKWIWEEDVICSPRTCSVCKHKFYIGRGWNFCPNCGAKMDKKEKDDGKDN